MEKGKISKNKGLVEHQQIDRKKNTSIFLVDNDTINVQDYCNFLCEFGYDAVGTTNPVYALEVLQTQTFEMLIFAIDLQDFSTEEFISRIKEVYFGQTIILLIDENTTSNITADTEHSFIDAYYNKSSDLWSFLSLIDSLNKNISLTEKVNSIREIIDGFIDKFSFLYQFQLPENLIETTLEHLLDLAHEKSGFIQVTFLDGIQENEIIYKGKGRYDVSQKDFYKMLSLDLKKKLVEAKNNASICTLPEGVLFPLIGFNNNTIGIIYVESKEIEHNVFNILKIFTRQAASLINNAMLHGMLDRQAEELMRSNAALNKNYLEVIEALRLAVDAKDGYTCGHSERVSKYAVAIGNKMKLPPDIIENLRIGGIFHDIGKIGVSDEILLKPARLTDEEYEKIKVHPTRGGEILSGITMFKEVVPIVEGHHEYFNGKGYPKGLKGDELSIGARIMALADAFDAMTSNREYHKKISFDDALGRIEQVRGTQFDPEIIDYFADLLQNNRDIIQEISEYK